MKVHAIETGRVRIKQAQVEGRGHGALRNLRAIASPGWTDWLPVTAFAIEHPEGVIVVDTGSGAHLNKLPRWHPYHRFAVNFDITPEQEIGPKLRALGIGPRDVKLVVLTHLHMDHDGGLAHFPHSRIVVDAGERQRASGVMGRIRGYLPERWPSWLDPEPVAWTPEPVGPFARSARLTKAGDVIAIPTPGHTPNHLCVLVELPGRRLVLAGDASYLEDTMLRGAVDGVSPNDAEAHETLVRLGQLRRERPTAYLPAHDPQTAARLSAALR